MSGFILTKLLVWSRDLSVQADHHFMPFYQVTDEGVTYFVSHAKSAAKLTHLSLCNTGITDVSLQVIKSKLIFRIIFICRYFLLNFNSFSGFYYFSDLKSLKVLELEKTKVGISNMSYIFIVCSRFSHLMIVLCNLCLSVCLTGRLAGWLAGWLNGRPTDWLTDWLTDRQTDRPTDWLK